MADDIRLVIGVEQKDLLKAITNTESLEGKVKKLSSVYARQSTALNKQSSEYKRYNKAITKLAKDTNYSKKELLSYGRALRADEKATKKASAEVKAFTLARKQATEEDRRLTSEKKIAVKATEDLARAEAKNAASLKSMRMATDSVYRNQQKRLQMKKLLKSAIAAETMTTQQAIVALKSYNAAQMSSTKAMGMARNKMNGNNMAIQQLGYQFGDFAVQVQGGTSAFVAFSQQGAQLAGILPMIAGPLGLSMGAAVGLSAALGILIPIGSAVARMFFEMKDSSKKSKSALDLLSQAVDDYSSAADIANLSTSSLVDRFGSLGEVARESARFIEEASRIDAIEKLNNSVKVLSDTFGDLGVNSNIGLDDEQITMYAAELGVAESKVRSFSEEMLNTAIKLGKEFSLSLPVATDLMLALQDFGKAEGLDAQVTSAANLNSMFLETFGSVEKIPLALRDTAVMAAKLSLEAAKIQGASEDTSEAEKERLERLTRIKGLMGKMDGDRRNANKVMKDSYDEEVSSLQASNDLTVKMLMHGRDSVEVKKLIKEQTLASYEADLKRQGFSEELITSLVSQKGEAIFLAEALERAESADARRSKISFPNLNMTNAMMAINYQQYGESRDAAPSAPSAPPKPKKSTAVKEDAFEKLTKELSRRKELLSLSKERAVVTRAIWSLEDSLGKSRAKYSAEEIKALVEKNIALKKTEDALEAARSKQESLAESIASSMGDALMGIVDGTMTVKDAFRSMARDIIKQLYQVIVVQRLVGSAEAGKESGLAGFIIKGLSSINANGNVFSGGSQIQAYANGGVVGGPTTFPMAGGKTGLMGEAGPEAIMPLKRGSNGKLGVQMEGGGGQNVVINQSFNFQANGDDTVKKLIAQAAPKIAQMTKSSLLDDRRRGGSTKAAFG